MSFYIKEICLDEQFSKYVFTGEKPTILPKLSKINILVGANNSGKSRFLRQLASSKQLKFVPNELDATENNLWLLFDECRETFSRQINSIFANAQVTDVGGLKDKLQRLSAFDWLLEGSSPGQNLAFILNEVLTWTHPSITHLGHFRKDTSELFSDIKKAADQRQKELSSLIANFEPKYEFLKIYIPTLRGLRALQNDIKDVYRERTEKDYFGASSDITTRPEIFTGLTLYTEVRNLLLGDLADREIIADFQRFLTNNFFEGKPVALIPKENKSVLDIKIGDEAERPVFELGDGIQSIIIITFPLFKNQGKKVLLFCEEPELYLHPGMQRVLLSVLNSFSKNQYFLTTHSNHFLDLTLDFKEASVYTFQKELEDSESKEKDAKFQVENLSSEDNRPLQLLGVRNSSVFLSNCTIWVEGITDRRYFQQYLKIYQESVKKAGKQFKEDWHYSFVEYGGSNVTHWSFLDTTKDPIDVGRLCGKLFLIADSDNAKGAKAERLKKLKENLGDRFYELKCKEVENLLSPKVLKTLIFKRENNGVEIPDFKHADYQSEPLGQFIENKILNGKATRKYSEGGTINDKTIFCENAVAELKTFDDLSEEAREIAIKLYAFIKENNHL